jgi:hypothetical protein
MLDGRRRSDPEHAGRPGAPVPGGPRPTPGSSRFEFGSHLYASIGVLGRRRSEGIVWQQAGSPWLDWEAAVKRSGSKRADVPMATAATLWARAASATDGRTGP